MYSEKTFKKLIILSKVKAWANKKGLKYIAKVCQKAMSMIIYKNNK